MKHNLLTHNEFVIFRRLPCSFSLVFWSFQDTPSTALKIFVQVISNLLLIFAVNVELSAPYKRKLSTVARKKLFSNSIQFVQSIPSLADSDFDILLVCFNSWTEIFKVAYYLQSVSLLGSKVTTSLVVQDVLCFLVVDMLAYCFCYCF